MVDNAFVYPEGCFFNSLEDIKGKNITVMGLGLNGGGEATVRFLLKHGANVILFWEIQMILIIFFAIETLFCTFVIPNV